MSDTPEKEDILRAKARVLDLLDACELGNIKDVEAWLQHSSNLLNEQKDADKQTALHLATKNGHLKIVQLLLQNGAQPCDKNKYGRIAMHYACFRGHTEIVKCLLKHMSSEDVNIIDDELSTPLHYAAKKRHFHIVKILLDHGASSSIKSKHGATAIHSACFRGEIVIVKCLLQHLSTDDVNTFDEYKITPLNIAVEKGHLDIVKLLLEHGAVADVKDRNGRTPLHFASQNGHTGVLKKLLQISPDLVNRKDDKSGMSALLLAVVNGHLETMEVLIKHGAVIDDCDSNGWSPLHHAAQKGHLEIVRKLLQLCPTFVDKRENRQNGTALHFAVMNGDLDTMEALLECGASVDSKNKAGWTPLHFATHKGHTEIVTKLLQISPELVHEKELKSKATPLHLAIQNKNMEIAKILIDNGAATEINDKHGFSPMHYATTNGHAEMLKNLLQPS